MQSSRPNNKTTIKTETRIDRNGRKTTIDYYYRNGNIVRMRLETDNFMSTYNTYRDGSILSEIHNGLYISYYQNGMIKSITNDDISYQFYPNGEFKSKT